MLEKEIISYFSMHGKQVPNLENKKNDDELFDYSSHDECQLMNTSDKLKVVQGETYKSKYDPSINKYLWVIKDNGVPIILESGPLGQTTARKHLSHTNLTGGLPAGCGGELWFSEGNKILLNGASSRYKARSPEELIDATKLFEICEYKVSSFGWDDDRAWPVKYPRGVK